MDKNERKSIRLTKENTSNLKQLVESENAKYAKSGHSRISENQVINEAVSYFHACRFGKDIFMEETERFQEIMTTNLNMVLRSYADQFAAALNHLSTELAYLKVVTNMQLADANTFGKNEAEVKKNIDLATKAKWKYEDYLIDSIIMNRRVD